jgi:hypothetical protein
MVEAGASETLKSLQALRSVLRSMRSRLGYTAAVCSSGETRDFIALKRVGTPAIV